MHEIPQHSLEHVDEYLALPCGPRLQRLAGEGSTLLRAGAAKVSL
jgi:hypothetical protein